MPPKQEKGVPNVVEVASSDDEDGIRVEKRKNPSSNKPLLQNRPKVNATATPGSGNSTLEARSFWKAGAYDISPTKWTPTEGSIYSIFLAQSYVCIFKFRIIRNKSWKLGMIL